MDRFHVAEPAAGQACPFCAQDLGGSPLIGHYRAYFSYASTELKTAVAEELATVERLHGGEAAAGFERAVRVCGERRQSWARFCGMPAVGLDTADLARALRGARGAVMEALRAEHGVPLDKLGSVKGTERDGR